MCLTFRCGSLQGIAANNGTELATALSPKTRLDKHARQHTRVLGITCPFCFLSILNPLFLCSSIAPNLFIPVKQDTGNSHRSKQSSRSAREPEGTAIGALVATIGGCITRSSCCHQSRSQFLFPKIRLEFLQTKCGLAP